MAGQQPGGRRSEERPPGAAGAGGRAAAGRPGHWFPLLLFGGLAALSLPLSALGSPQLPTGIAEFAVTYPTVTQAMYLGGGAAAGPFPFPLGWYWVGVLVAGLLVTAAWYRWRDRRSGSRTPLGGYLVSGLALAAVTAALPLLAWGKPVQADGPGLQAWTWLDALWRLGTFALLAVAVSLGVLARIGRSRTLAVVTAAYTAAVCFAGWHDLRQPVILPVFYPSGDHSVLLPAAVLLLAGLGTLATAPQKRYPVNHSRSPAGATGTGWRPGRRGTTGR
jgi:hypothetical protein